MMRGKDKQIVGTKEWEGDVIDDSLEKTAR